MIIQLVTYNMGMGASRQDREEFFAPKEEAFRIFADSFSRLYNADRSSTWLLCLQEIDRDYGGCNQVEELQKELELQTGVDWYKHSNTRDESRNDEAVAIFSTVPAAADFTVKAWTPAGDIIDYLLVNPGGRCTTAPPVIRNFQGPDGRYASDHKGMQMTVTLR